MRRIILTRACLIGWSNKTLPFLVCFAVIFYWANNINRNITQQLFKKSKVHASIKYILLWNAHDFAPLYYLGRGSDAFKKCSVRNCYVTTNRNFFKGNISRFDAIAFNGRQIESLNRSNLPKARSPHQKYIFFNMESAENYPVCNRRFDGFFNWTATYKLNSDIIFAYLLIRDAEGESVGPKTHMTWKVTNGTEDMARFKSKGVMWLASNCHTKSNRETLIRMLDIELKSLYFSLDQYGNCGNLKCPKDRCEEIIKKHSFYLAFENSFAEDYVTEKVYTALKNGVIPVVFGGADYSRFLPPGSYIDALKLSPPELASTLVDIIENPNTYNRFFWWKKYYSFYRPESYENVCSVCAALNNKTMLETRSVYKDFRRWWNPNYMSQCVQARPKREDASKQDIVKLWSQLY